VADPAPVANPSHRQLHSGSPQQARYY